MSNTSTPPRRQRGEIETLPSGSLRVRVYAGIDPVSKKRHYLVETIPAGPKAVREAEKARTKLLNQVDEKRNPRTRATVSQLMDRYLQVLNVDETTRATYEGLVRNHIRPVLGHLPVGRLDGEVLDSFYLQLRTCRAHCRGRKFTAHRTELAWGMLVWLAMVTGARRGELCALRWDRLDFAIGVLTIRSSIAQRGGKTWEKHTKTHQQRRITLDDQTLALLRAYLRRCTERAAALGFDLPTDARIFSLEPDGSTWLKPDSVSQRYAKMCARLGWDMNIHQLRHYSATELIAAGVDVRTVAGRLGHGGGGATTLRVYSAWVSEADQRAAGTLAGRMPALPAGVDQDGALIDVVRPVTDASAPYRRIAADLRAAITCGALCPGDQFPTESDLATRYGVAASTAHRAIADLTLAGLAMASRGKRAVVAKPEPA